MNGSPSSSKFIYNFSVSNSSIKFFISLLFLVHLSVGFIKIPVSICCLVNYAVSNLDYVVNNEMANVQGSGLDMICSNSITGVEGQETISKHFSQGSSVFLWAFTYSKFIIVVNLVNFFFYAVLIFCKGAYFGNLCFIPRALAAISFSRLSVSPQTFMKHSLLKVSKTLLNSLTRAAQRCYETQPLS
jgi:hypothetical protein